MPELDTVSSTQHRASTCSVPLTNSTTIHNGNTTVVGVMAVNIGAYCAICACIYGREGNRKPPATKSNTTTVTHITVCCVTVSNMVARLLTSTWPLARALRNLPRASANEFQQHGHGRQHPLRPRAGLFFPSATCDHEMNQQRSAEQTSFGRFTQTFYCPFIQHNVQNVKVECQDCNASFRMSNTCLKTPKRHLEHLDRR